MELQEKLLELEERLARLERDRDTLLAGRPGASRPAPTDSAMSGLADVPADSLAARDPDTFWALTALTRRHPEGAVVFAGSVPRPEGRIEWQWGRGADDVAQSDWTVHAPALSALAHPVRLGILQAVLAGASSVGELVGVEGLGTSGQLYHHLNQLVAQGWLAAVARGRYAVPASRIVPLLIILTATERTA